MLHAIQSGRIVRTVFLTAGDNGADAAHWQEREFGVQASYAQMGEAANSWTQTDAIITGHAIPIFTLLGKPSVSLAFMRLPDGNRDGSGFSSTNRESLKHLWTGLIPNIETIDGSSSYSKTTLTNTLTNLMLDFQPDQINTQDYAGTYDDSDHSDHHSVAYFVLAAVQHYTAPHRLTGYEGYTTSSRLANVTGTDIIAKQNAFYAYAHYDRFIGGVPKFFPESWRMNVKLRRIIFDLRSQVRYLRKSALRFIRHNTLSSVSMSHTAWLQRQYTVGSIIKSTSEENH